MILKNQSFNDIIINSSYRQCNQYLINFDLIENELTNLLLKNKKLLNDEIISFSYNNEIFANNITDIINLIKDKYLFNYIEIDDELIIYEFYKDIENCTYSHKQIIHDFLEIIKLLNKEKNDKSIQKKKIFELFKLNDNFSYAFKKIFENQDRFTVDKIWAIFDYYLKLIYKNVIKDIINYQEKLNEQSIEKINNYFNKNRFINKAYFAYVIRLFIILVLYFEEDKENKIKNNCNNIMNYLWDKNKQNNTELKDDINELEHINIKVNQIISLYEIIGNDFANKFFNDINKKLKEKKEKKNNISEDEDDFNGNDINDNYKD